MQSKLSKQVHYLNYQTKKCISQAKVLYIEDLGETEDFVYDLETECGMYQCGVGGLLLKNTDSVFIKFNTKYNDALMDAWADGDKEKIKELSQKNIEESFRLGKEAADRITTEFKDPIKLEFEKVYLPLVMLGKKRYIGSLYSSNTETPDKLDYKGIELKRRDNTLLLKETYQRIIDMVLEYGPKSKEVVRKYISEQLEALHSEKIDIEKLIISKTLKKGYKVANLPHKRLAETMYRRDLETKAVEALRETSFLPKEIKSLMRQDIIDYMVDEYSWCLAPSWNETELWLLPEKKLLKMIENFQPSQPVPETKSDMIRLLTRDKIPYPSNAPKLNERIRYIYVDNGFVGKNASQYEITEDPDFYLEQKKTNPTLKIHARYYAEHQLTEPIINFFKSIDPEIELFIKQEIERIMPYKKQAKVTRTRKGKEKLEPKQQTLFDLLQK
jgi:DNA polymerase elongation subunit (family B)